MRPKLDPASLKESKPWEYALRFGFGGLVTAGAGLVAHQWGPAVGGLFLAFPAILPASLTLVKRHDGRAKAIDDARGARIGAAALTIFALVLGLRAETWPPLVLLGFATALWIAISIGAWAIVHGGDGRPR